MSSKDNKTNIWVLDKIGSDLPIMKKFILESKWSYFSHIVKSSSKVEKQIIQGAEKGRCARERSPISWPDDVEKVTSHGMYGATNLASDRGRWSTLVEAAAAHN